MDQGQKTEHMCVGRKPEELLSALKPLGSPEPGSPTPPASPGHGAEAQGSPSGTVSRAVTGGRSPRAWGSHSSLPPKSGVTLGSPPELAEPDASLFSHCGFDFSIWAVKEVVL